jgi:hypothetical protein
VVGRLEGTIKEARASGQAREGLSNLILGMKQDVQNVFGGPVDLQAKDEGGLPRMIDNEYVDIAFCDRAHIPQAMGIQVVRSYTSYYSFGKMVDGQPQILLQWRE